MIDAIVSPLFNADGSCELIMGERIKIILCGIIGPGDVSSSKRIYDSTNVFFSINRLSQKNKEELTTTVNPSISHLASTACSTQPADRFLYSIVESAIDVAAYPRTGIQICTQELKSDGPSNSAQLNAICLALLDSGIRMNYVFAAVTISLMEANDELFLEPDQLLANASKAIFTFVFRPSIILAGKLIGTHSTGQFTFEQNEKAMELAEKNCLPIFDFYRRKMQEKFIYNINRGT